MSSINTDKEIETRIMVSDKNLELVQNKLESLGFSKDEEFVQKDIILDKPDASLFKSGQKIRIREEKDMLELTYKGLFEGSQDFSRRTEINIPLNSNQVDDLMLVFESLGYPFLFQIIKQRIVYKKDSLKATFDTWPIIGTMLEIEGPESDVKIIIEAFGSEFEFKNFRLKDLFLNEVAKTGKSLDELKKIYEKSTGNMLGKIELIVE